MRAAPGGHPAQRAALCRSVPRTGQPLLPALKGAALLPVCKTRTDLLPISAIPAELVPVLGIATVLGLTLGGGLGLAVTGIAFGVSDGIKYVKERFQAPKQQEQEPLSTGEEQLSCTVSQGALDTAAKRVADNQVSQVAIDAADRQLSGMASKADIEAVLKEQEANREGLRALEKQVEELTEQVSILAKARVRVRTSSNQPR